MMESSTPKSPKANWPLIALAATAFIPGLGFVLGAIALTWAMATSRSKARLAGILAVAGILVNAGLAVFAYQMMTGDPRVQEIRRRITADQLVEVVDALEEYRRKHGQYPARLGSLIAIPNPLHPLNIYDQSAGISVPMPTYQYLPSGRQDEYDLFAVGADGTAGTEDDIRPELADSVRIRTGFRPPK